MLNTDLFRKIRINKQVGLPLLVLETEGKSKKIDSNQLTSWLVNLTGWGSACGFKGAMQLADELVHLNEDGTKLLLLFPGEPELEDLHASVERSAENCHVVPQANHGFPK